MKEDRIIDTELGKDGIFRVVEGVCTCEMQPGKIFWVNDPNVMIHEECGKKIR